MKHAKIGYLLFRVYSINAIVNKECRWVQKVSMTTYATQYDFLNIDMLGCRVFHGNVLTSHQMRIFQTHVTDMFYVQQNYT